MHIHTYKKKMVVDKGDYYDFSYTFQKHNAEVSWDDVSTFLSHHYVEGLKVEDKGLLYISFRVYKNKLYKSLRFKFSLLHSLFVYHEELYISPEPEYATTEMEHIVTTGSSRHRATSTLDTFIEVACDIPSISGYFDRENNEVVMMGDTNKTLSDIEGKAKLVSDNTDLIEVDVTWKSNTRALGVTLSFDKVNIMHVAPKGSRYNITNCYLEYEGKKTQIWFDSRNRSKTLIGTDIVESTSGYFEVPDYTVGNGFINIDIHSGIETKSWQFSI